MDNLHKKQKIDNYSSNNTNTNNTSNVNITTNNEVYNIPFNMYPEDNKPVSSVNMAKIPSDKDLYNLLNSGEFIM
jgi:hypothetical protein